MFNVCIGTVGEPRLEPRQVPEQPLVMGGPQVRTSDDQNTRNLNLRKLTELPHSLLYLQVIVSTDYEHLLLSFSLIKYYVK